MHSKHLVGAIYLDRGYRACKYFMEHRIIGPYINLEKISRKEVNFKSKLIEWSQKNRFEVTFELITQSHDQGYNPTSRVKFWWKVFREEKEPVILKKSLSKWLRVWLWEK